MGHYRSTLRDLEFNLFEVFDRSEILGTGPYQDVDQETARSILAEVDRLARHELADSLPDSDRTPPTFDPATHTVTLPESLKRSYRAYQDAEWWRLDLPAELGGTPIPRSLRWAVAELVLGANPAVHLYSSGDSFAHLLWVLGTEDQKRLASWIAAKRWATTMVLTEPDAGSDVGASRTTATPQSDGSWHLNGVKRFITGGEHDLTANIVHFVLARPDGHSPGTKGLSLFLVPKYLVDLDTGELGERNGVYATNLEHKMGLKASTTCELTFGADRPAKGWLLGGIHDGIAQMFEIIEIARMMVGTKAIATLSTGYLNALDYAKTRLQGPDLTRAMDKTAPKVPIIRHPEVRRSLLTQKAYAEGLRALVLYTATQQDAIQLARHAGRTDEAADRLNDLLLPLVKGVGSERSYALLGDALQVFGGSGYLQDYPIEQYIRDAKIDTLYEGTTAIQALDLFFRKIVKDNGTGLGQLLGEIQSFAKGDAGNGALGTERGLLNTALEDVQGIVGAMAMAAMASRQDPPSIYKVGQNNVRLLLALGDLVIGWLLLRQAEVALAALDRLDGLDSGGSQPGRNSGTDRDFYTGKVAAARFFAASVLPQLSSVRAVVEAVDNELMTVPDSAF